MLKSTRPPSAIDPAWAPGTVREFTRCVRRTYRLGLVRPGQACLLWVSGRAEPGVHALGTVLGEPEDGPDGPVLDVRLARLADPVPRARLLADAAVRDAEVLRVPVGSNPSWLSAGQFAAVLTAARADADLDRHGLRPWSP